MLQSDFPFSGVSGVTLDRIYIATNPTKTAYEHGETFDPTGMVVKADYLMNGSPYASEEVTGYTYPTTALTAGTTSVTISYTSDGVTKTASVSISVIGSLNDTDWATISAASNAGNADTYWDVGDRKAVTLNGKVGKYTFTNETYYAFIIGFNHNSKLEGDNRIHFQFAKTALSDGADVCFVDGSWGSQVSTAAFHMNSSNKNSGGWGSSYMRQTICGTSLESYTGTFIAALPSALRSVLKTVTKYTDNTGGGTNSASYVTATTDVIFLLAEFEVFGTRTYANSAEKNKQAQYAYYSVGNSKVKYKHNATTTASVWWLRSPHSTGSVSFVFVSTSGSASSTNASSSRGFAPGFCV